MKHFAAIAILAMAILAVAPSKAFALETQPYVTAGLGYFGLHRLSDNEFGGYVGAGVNLPEAQYREVHFAAEARLGTVADGSNFVAGPNTETLYDVSYFLSGLAKAKYSFMQELRGYALLGVTVAGWSYEFRQNGLLQVSDSGTDIDLSFGLGLDYRLRNELLLGIEWVRYTSDMNGLAATISYEF